MPEPAPSDAGGPDVLSEVLRTIRLTGALFFVIDASVPWAVQVPVASALEPVLLPGAEHLVSYHVVLRGECWGQVPGLPPERLQAGDIVVFPRGDAYLLSSAPGMRVESGLEAALGFFRAMVAGELPLLVTEGGGEDEGIGLVCGFLGCDLRPFNPVLSALPKLIRVRGGKRPDAGPLGRLVDLVVAESQQWRAGRDCVVQRLGELMFVEVVRRYLVTLGEEATGWLAGLRHPIVGRALGLLHTRPSERWTLGGLASAVAVSRSVLSERFTTVIGQPPMQYLARWRLQLAARQLVDGAEKVAVVAHRVGYESEAAFSRAFRRVVGVSPSEWRRQRTRGRPGCGPPTSARRSSW
jgi:AraC-like DNA-binding protein